MHFFVYNVSETEKKRIHLFSKHQLEKKKKIKNFYMWQIWDLIIFSFKVLMDWPIKWAALWMLFP